MWYFLYVLRHKWIVLVEGLRLGGIPVWQLLAHDLSKLTKDEREYRKIALHGASVAEDPEVKKSRVKHYRRNRHHHRHWVKDGTPAPMPERYVREMVADWIATDKSFAGGNGNIGPWLKRNYKNMVLHPETQKRLVCVLREIGVDVNKL